MNKWELFSLVLIVIFLPFPLAAGDFDGSKPLICILADTKECTPVNDCQEVTAEDMNVPHILKVDFERKIIRAVGEGDRRGSSIKNKEHIDGKLILQGAEDGFENYQDGLGWSMAIAKLNGEMVLTASGDNVAFVIFGECVPTAYLQ